MPKTSPASIVSALANANLGDCYIAVRLDLDSAPVYLWSGYGNTTIGGNTYLGAGDLLSLDPVVESAELGAEGLRVSFSGANSTLLTAALTEDYQDRDAFVYFGLTSAPDDEQEIFRGYLDTAPIRDTGDNATITVTIENKLRDLQRARVRRYTNEDQEDAYSGDTFFAWVTAIQDVRVPWGRFDNVGGFGGGSGGGDFA